MAPEAGPGGPATHLLRSLVQLGGTLLATAHTRVELLTTEISEDVERGVRILLWVFVAVQCGVLAMLLAGAAVIVYFWDSHRIAATLGVTIAFAIGAGLAAAMARAGLAAKPRLLDATRTELQRDVASLRGRS